jgi:hypothetical protein
VSAAVVGPYDPSQTDAVFRRVMAAVTEQACIEGREVAVMDALFAVFVGVGDDDGEDLGL